MPADTQDAAAAETGPGACGAPASATFLQPADYAVVVGVSRYPALGAASGRSPDLFGPDNDAEAVCRWLTSLDGGGLNPGNIRCLRTRDFAGTADHQPNLGKIQEVFHWLNALAQTNREANQGQTVGRRLYIYMSGHGFSISRLQGALFTARASTQLPENVFASGWLEWLQDMGYFKEYVLWMDCCMDRTITVVPEAIPSKSGAGAAAGPTFIGFAAARPFRTVERPMPADGNKYHGVFTWALLEGLRGAAAQPDGAITGRSLGDYVFSAMKALLSPEDLAARDVSKEPAIFPDQRPLIFRDKVPLLRHAVTLRLPPAASLREIQIWGGMPCAVVASAVREEGTTLAEAALPTGLYVVAGADGFRRGIEVTTSGELDCTAGTRGDAVQRPADGGAKHPVFLDPHNPAAEITLFDALLAKIYIVPRLLSTALDFGVYKFRVGVGAEFAETIVLVDGKESGIDLAAPKLATPAPIPGSAFTSEHHAEAVESIRRARPHWGKSKIKSRSFAAQPGRAARSEIHLMARFQGRQAGEFLSENPCQGISLHHTNGDLLMDLGELSIETPSPEAPDGWTIFRAEVKPGIYLLRQEAAGGKRWEQSVVASPGWSVGIYLLTLPAQGWEAPGEVFLERTMLMQRPGAPGDPGMEAVVETARLALADERRILTPELARLLLRKYRNPIAGIIGAHLLIAAAEDPAGSVPPPGDAKLKDLDEAVIALRRMVGGATHPDVEILSLYCPNPNLRARTAFSEPPIFERSWRLLRAASAKDPRLVASELWRRIHAAAASGGYLVWAGDDGSKASHLAQLRSWIRATMEMQSPAAEMAGPDGADPAAATNLTRAAARIGVPPAEFETLWNEVRQEETAPAAGGLLSG